MSTLDRLVAGAARDQLPALKIAGTEPSKFRAARAGRGRGDRRADPILGRPAGPGRAGLPAPGGLRLRDAAAARHAADGGRRRVRLPRRRAAQAAAVDAGAAAWSGCGGSAWSPSACGGATCCSTRPYLARLSAQKTRLWRRRRRPEPLADAGRLLRRLRPASAHDPCQAVGLLRRGRRPGRSRPAAPGWPRRRARRPEPAAKASAARHAQRGGELVLPAQVRAEHRRIVGVDRAARRRLPAAAAADGRPGSPPRPVRRLEVGQTSSTIPRSTISASTAGSSTARMPCRMRCGSTERTSRTESGPAASPACGTRAEPTVAGDRERLPVRRERVWPPGRRAPARRPRGRRSAPRPGRPPRPRRRSSPRYRSGVNRTVTPCRS